MGEVKRRSKEKRLKIFEEKNKTNQKKEIKKMNERKK